MTVDVPAGIDADAVTAWLASRVPLLSEPLTFEMIQGGRSNLTFTVTDADDRRWVLRRPPLHHVLQSAHDVGREHRLMDALQGSIPVPPLVGLETDPGVNGAPFFVMDFVDGHVVRSVAEGADFSPAWRAAASHALVDTLLALHAVDVEAVGLGDLGRHDGYISRQLRRWWGQYEAGAERDLPLVKHVHDRLAATIPEQQKVAIVHGDYRLDNVMMGDDGQVLAVLDWELCTLGDPMADLGLLMVYWAQPGDVAIPLLDAATVLDGFASRDEVIARYAAGSDLDVGQLDYYVAFAYWKLALILEGVLTRFAAGAYGDDADDGTRAFMQVVDTLLDNADAAISRRDAS